MAGGTWALRDVAVKQRRSMWTPAMDPDIETVALRKPGPWQVSSSPSLLQVTAHVKVAHTSLGSLGSFRPATLQRCPYSLPCHTTHWWIQLTCSRFLGLIFFFLLLHTFFLLKIWKYGTGTDLFTFWTTCFDIFFVTLQQTEHVPLWQVYAVTLLTNQKELFFFFSLAWWNERRETRSESRPSM